jgi:hypothetical protein
VGPRSRVRLGRHRAGVTGPRRDRNTAAGLRARRGAPTTLRIAVPAGRHEARLLTGDLDFASGNTIVTIDGAVVAESGNEEIPQGRFEWIGFSLDGGSAGRTVDMQLTGALRDGFWRLNALLVLS